MHTTQRMKLSEFAKLNALSYRTALNLFNRGEIKGIQTPSGTIRVEGWAESVNPTSTDLVERLAMELAGTQWDALTQTQQHHYLNQAQTAAKILLRN